MEKAVSKKRINNPRFALTLREKVFNNCNGSDITERWESYFVEIFKLVAHPAMLRFGLKCPTEFTESDKKIRITDFHLSLLIRQNTFRIECII